MDRIMGGVAIGVGLAMLIFSGRISANQAASVRFMTTERGKQFAMALAVVVGMGFAMGGAQYILGYASAGGAPYPDGAPNRAADYFVGGTMIVGGLSLAIFRRRYAEYLARYYANYAAFAENEGRVLMMVFPVVMGLSLLAIGVSAVTGYIGGTHVAGP
jgi:hypothetical protein